MTTPEEIVEYFVFRPDGRLEYTCNTLHGMEPDIAARSLTAVGSSTALDLDYTYTWSGTEIVSEHTPVQAPPEL
jgi:hypothetical protein